jgi:FlaA1/EpsC-like NDP-sugar epimerase
MIKANRPIRVAVPEMTRFLLTPIQSGRPLHALTSAEGGEIFVRKAPARP